ncbi:MAG: hypothetical protein B6244_10680 [Candidatus Cloacimonetes bacterium 4572_55]|nr:MAG: hypothetical protein B6244_10680 [Candidatus Cloacimonetes bacterium 4572_55]
MKFIRMTIFLIGIGLICTSHVWALQADLDNLSHESVSKDTTQIVPNPINDPKANKSAFTNLNPINKDDQIDSLHPGDIVDPKGTKSSEPFSNTGLENIQKAHPDSSPEPRAIIDNRGKGDPVLTNMQTYTESKDGEIRYLMTRGTDLRKVEFILNPNIDVTPREEREEVYTFLPSSREQKHIDLIDYLASYSNIDNVGKLQICISEKMVNEFRLRCFRQWSEAETGKVPPENNATIVDFKKKIELYQVCINELGQQLTELEVIQSNEKYSVNKSKDD